MARLSELTGRSGAVLLAAVLCSGCPSPPKEGPPPEESLGVASAAPRALGALAGGTEAAPHALSSPVGPRLGSEEGAPELDDEDEEDGGAVPTPDAGTAAPEELPL